VQSCTLRRRRRTIQLPRMQSASSSLKAGRALLLATDDAAIRPAEPGKILIIDEDRDIGDIVTMVLSDAGFRVSVLATASPDAVRTGVGKLEPDCVLLDGAISSGYQLWEEAAWLSVRDRHVPVIMFTTDQRAVKEAHELATARSQAAHFDAVLGKPFDIDELVDAVAHAVGAAVPFESSPQAEERRTQVLKAKLEAAGAHEISTSTRREWANFRTADGTLVQIYWWQRDGVYYVIRYAESGGRLDLVGRLYDLDAAIGLGMLIRAAAN
jgi:DNA-binding response OmpR family regulator